MIKIFVSLLFEINLQSKIIILKYLLNFFFLKEINLENQIVLVAVKKKNRNLGVGSMLIKCLRKKKYKKIYVSSDLSNNKAHNFYLKNGFNYFKVMKLGLRKIKVFECKLS
jgi:ribosomal protein S18 acetylase RimI-like enzyme